MFTLLEIKNILNASCITVLEKDPAVYADISNAAKSIYEDGTGLQLADRPEWAKVPFAYIVDFLTSNKLSGLSEQAVKRFEDNYQKALKILDEHLEKRVNAGKIGIIGGLYSADY